MHSGGFELTKLTYTRLEDNLIRHRGRPGMRVSENPNKNCVYAHYLGAYLYSAGARYSAGEIAWRIPALYRDPHCMIHRAYLCVEQPGNSLREHLFCACVRFFGQGCW